MHVLTNAEKLIPLRDAASLAESRRLAGMRMVTGTTSPSTRYERISVSPASCSIKSEYVIASHAFKPQYKCINYTPAWEQRKFVDFVEASGIRNKDNLQLESYSVSNDRGFVPQDEQFENGGTMRDADKTAYWIVEPGSFAYNPARINVGSIGYQSTRKNVIVSSLYEVFKTDRSCDDRFLWHWFKSSLFTKQIEMLQEGGVRLYFFFDKLQKSEIWMPNVDEQRIIGQQFDQLDSLITLHKRKYDKLVVFKKSMLEKMFPKDGESVPEIRFAGFTDPWEQRKLGDVADIKTGPFGTLLHAEDYVDDGIPIVTTEHFKTGALPKDKEGIPQVSEEDAKRLEQYRAKEGDILFSRVGSVDANAQVFAGQDGWLFSGRVLRARPDLTLVSSAYLHYELETEEVKSSVISRAVGGTMASINTEILFQTPIFIPAKMTEQNKIGSTCARLDSLITLHQRKLELLQNIKKSLLDKMFV